MIEYIDYSPPANLMSGRIILVTGAGSGIGRAVACALAQYNATVVLLGRTRKKLEQVYDEIVATDAPTPAVVEADLEKLSWDDYLKLAEALNEQFGRLDGLLHNASLLGERAPIEHYDTMSWHRVMHVNVSAPFLLTRALMGLLKKPEDASVLFTTSGVGRVGRAYWGAYAVSKFATDGFMQVLSDELANTNVRANCINPGATRTAMRAAAYPAEDPATLATPESLVPAYLYLLGPDSRTVTGKTFDAQRSANSKPATR